MKRLLVIASLAAVALAALVLLQRTKKAHGAAFDSREARGVPAIAGDEMPCPLPLTKAGVCKLHGKVKIVDSFPKYKIKVVNSFPDIKVQKVTSFPDSDGKWQFVDSFPDFTVQLVDSFPDFTVQYVDSFPGCS